VIAKRRLDKVETEKVPRPLKKPFLAIKVSEIGLYCVTDRVLGTSEIILNQTYEMRFTLKNVPADVRDANFAYKGWINGKSIDFSEVGITIKSREGCWIPLKEKGAFQLILFFALELEHQLPIDLTRESNDEFLFSAGITKGCQLWALEKICVYDLDLEDSTSFEKPIEYSEAIELAQQLQTAKADSLRFLQDLVRRGKRQSIDYQLILEAAFKSELQVIARLLDTPEKQMPFLNLLSRVVVINQDTSTEKESTKKKD
jgi:hypothetical protein